MNIIFGKGGVILSGEKAWISGEKYSILIVIAIIAVVGMVYFVFEGNSAGMDPIGKKETAAFNGMQLKLAFNDGNEAKVFALASNNALAKYAAMEGNPVPEEDSMVIGATEADTMKSENIFLQPGDRLIGFFGLNPTVEGVLAETGTPLDYFHFLSPLGFSAVNAYNGLVFIKMSGEEPKLFVSFLPGGKIPAPKLAEGSLDGYEEHVIVGKKFYPIIIGSGEAALMRKEKVFNEIGDSFEKFGQRFIVAGIMEKTGSAFDFAHFVPFGEGQLQ